MKLPKYVVVTYQSDGYSRCYDDGVESLREAKELVRDYLYSDPRMNVAIARLVKVNRREKKTKR